MSKLPTPPSEGPSTEPSEESSGASAAPAVSEARTRLPLGRADATRAAIRDAVIDVLAEEHPATLSIPAVAKRAGISVRTVYRYFGSKQELLDDVAEIHLRRADAVVERRADLFDRPDVYLAVLWRDFADNLESVWAQHRSPAGAELRRRRLTETKRGLMPRLAKGFPDNTEAEREELADLIVTMLSSAAFLELHTRLGRSPEDAARMAMWAVTAMQKQFKRDGGMT